jgi:carbon-monoxide dehydrogenase medium subunit
MIPASFDYAAPRTLAEAVTLLAGNPEAKVLAGGHSLVPAMKLRLAQPPLLIDLGRVADLAYIREEGNQIRIGAMTTHYQIESSARLKEICPLLPETAIAIGDVQVRNKGTIGGSLAHSDPAADWPAAVLALRADFVASSARGDRVIKADEFFVDLMTTALQPDEILREVRIAVPQRGTGQAYLKVRQPASGFAVVGIAASITASGNKCTAAGVGITGVSARAHRANAVEEALVGQALDAQTIAAAAARASEGVEANSDLYASAEYRKHLAEVYTRRALQKALERAA